jgi:hypothetical protein
MHERSDEWVAVATAPDGTEVVTRAADAATALSALVAHAAARPA